MNFDPGPGPKVLRRSVCEISQANMSHLTANGSVAARPKWVKVGSGWVSWA